MITWTTANVMTGAYGQNRIGYVEAILQYDNGMVLTKLYGRKQPIWFVLNQIDIMRRR